LMSNFKTLPHLRTAAFVRSLTDAQFGVVGFQPVYRE
jgi:hypothetical protein